MSALYRRWTASDIRSPKRVMDGSAAWLADGNLGALIGIGLAVPLAHVDARLWPVVDAAPATLDGSLPISPLAFGAVLVFVFHAAILDRFLAVQTRQERALPFWLKAVRYLAGGLPLLGLYTVPAWRAFLRSRLAADLARRAVPPVSWLSLRGRLWRRRVPGSRWLVSPGAVAFLVAIDVGFLAWSAFVVSSEPALFTLSALLHLAAFLGFAWHLWQRGHETHLGPGRRLAAGLLACFWLIPVPLLPLLGMLAFVLLPTPDPDAMLVRRAYQRQAGVPPLPGLAAMLAERWAAVSWWRRLASRVPKLARDLPPGDRERRIGWLYRVKSGMVPLDAAFLALLMHAFLGDLPRLLVAAGCLSAGLGAAALLWLVAFSLLRLLDPPGRERILDRHPYPRYLALTQLGFAGGLQLGDGLVTGDHDKAGFVLLAGGLTGIVATILPIVLPLPEPVPRPSAQEQMVPRLLFITAAIMGLQLLEPERYEDVQRLLETAVGFLPALGMLTATALAPYLVHPFHTRQAFTGELPADLRRAVAVLTGSAVLPLGGLLVPLWIYMRHRRWAEHERRWLEIREGRVPPGQERHPSG